MLFIDFSGCFNFSSPQCLPFYLEVIGSIHGMKYLLLKVTSMLLFYPEQRKDRSLLFLFLQVIF